MTAVNNPKGEPAEPEIVAPERLVFVNFFSDEKGNTTRHPLSPTWPLEVLNTLTFSEHGGQTTVTLRAVPQAATESERQTLAAGRQATLKLVDAKPLGSGVVALTYQSV